MFVLIERTKGYDKKVLKKSRDLQGIADYINAKNGNLDLLQGIEPGIDLEAFEEEFL